MLTLLGSFSQTKDHFMLFVSSWNLALTIAPAKTNIETNLFLISRQKHMCGYSLEEPHWGSSNEYPQHMFLSRNKKNIGNFYWKHCLIWNNGIDINVIDISSAFFPFYGILKAVWLNHGMLEVLWEPGCSWLLDKVHATNIEFELSEYRKTSARYRQTEIKSYTVFDLITTHTPIMHSQAIS